MGRARPLPNTLDPLMDTWEKRFKKKKTFCSVIRSAVLLPLLLLLVHFKALKRFAVQLLMATATAARFCEVTATRPSEADVRHSGRVYQLKLRAGCTISSKCGGFPPVSQYKYGVIITTGLKA